MAKYQRKAYPVEAVQWTGPESTEAVAALVGRRYRVKARATALQIHGGGPPVSLRAGVGDYVVVGKREPVVVYSSGEFEARFEKPAPRVKRKSRAKLVPVVEAAPAPALVVEVAPEPAPAKKPAAKKKVTTRRSRRRQTTRGSVKPK